MWVDYLLLLSANVKETALITYLLSRLQDTFKFLLSGLLVFLVQVLSEELDNLLPSEALLSESFLSLQTFGLQ